MIGTAERKGLACETSAVVSVTTHPGTGAHCAGPLVLFDLGSLRVGWAWLREYDEHHVTQICITRPPTAVHVCLWSQCVFQYHQDNVQQLDLPVLVLVS